MSGNDPDRRLFTRGRTSTRRAERASELDLSPLATSRSTSRRCWSSSWTSRSAPSARCSAAPCTQFRLPDSHLRNNSGHNQSNVRRIRRNELPRLSSREVSFSSLFLFYLFFFREETLDRSNLWNLFEFVLPNGEQRNLEGHLLLWTDPEG